MEKSDKIKMKTHKIRTFMGITDQRDSFTCEQVDAGQQGNCSKPLIFMVTVNFPVSFCRAQVSQEAPVLSVRLYFKPCMVLRNKAVQK